MRVLLTGCSGGGKSTLTAALAEAGVATVAEPGRRVIAAGGPMPWDDPVGFAHACLVLASEDHAAAGAVPTVFDRGWLDAALNLTMMGHPVDALACRYDRVVLAPPWPEIYVQDAERRHDFAAARAEYDMIAARLPELGYRAHVLSRSPVVERVSELQVLLAAEAPA